MRSSHRNRSISRSRRSRMTPAEFLAPAEEAKKYGNRGEDHQRAEETGREEVGPYGCPLTFKGVALSIPVLPAPSSPVWL